MVKILIAILIFGFLILIHEFGHYIMARVFKVGINEFSIGMGPKLLQKKSKKTGIAYTLRLLPSVALSAWRVRTRNRKVKIRTAPSPIWQRFLFLLPGQLLNILVGVILTCIISRKT